ncbi:DNA-binding protein WhiA [Culicoidibacter larvae]|uniref:Probable cell division protein WhiA n=1 Tax=Culicoidibacter larvae TaxID=2579976 RepID=A0A5R8QHV4_9FIRM|nr:DNA-binding protein WhiA [Culicoidibacter larvae]TLG77306.1 DNA-binding protein WhiA [Culicoidibacter larvae]
MPTFTTLVKEELINVEEEQQLHSELAALIRLCGRIIFTNMGMGVAIQTESAATSRRIYVLLKKLYAVHTEIMVRRKTKLKKNNVYIIRVEKAKEILTDIHMLGEDGFELRIDERLIASTNDKIGYLRGAFLASGSVNDPRVSRYHLEIFSQSREHAEDLMDVMNSFELNTKVTDRKRGSITYIKEAEKITDFIGLIGATNALFAFEDMRITRDMRNAINRISNCEIANEQKSIRATEQQIANIELIRDELGFEVLGSKAQQVAHFRLANPDATLAELAEIMNEARISISKSGINHNMRAIATLADNIRSSTK